ncbi:MAG: class I SAM-dependent methyltransferase [Deltaproteobacteria bacterium]|nr:class I SAM-dependent methyltransferase [Deltaproteobacteria bacterium]
MKVLKNWNEIGNAVNSLVKAGLPLHSTPAKCWDFNNIREVFSQSPFNESSHIVDLGCGPSLNGCMTLELLYSMGYRNLTGVDIHIPGYTRLAAAIRGFKKARNMKQYKMVTSDITATKFPDNSVDGAVLLSVVEHGVDLEKLFSELKRIMRQGGKVYLSTDYWEKGAGLGKDAMAASGALDNKALPWTIFDKKAVENLIMIAEANGFNAQGGGSIPPCEDRPVYWQDIDYTFIALVFEKK